MTTLIEHLRVGALYEEYGDVKDAVEELERQAKEIEALKADAERYQALRAALIKDDCEFTGRVETWLEENVKDIITEALTDAAFDAAIEQQTRETP